ncbi:MAG: DUF3500 domain-containing protein [Bacteroidetes bacterium]|nr:DUF3500 domain-containing protein [Bacteroidota bacterium]
MKKLVLIYIVGIGSLMAQPSFDPLSGVSALINSLTPAQKEIVSFALEDPAKTRWHYLPHDSFAREGLPLSEMTAGQIEKTYALLEAYLSESGYDQMQQIIDLENYLAIVENNPYKRDASKYYIAFYGTPHKDSLWAWSFEGHHLSLNFTVSPEAIAFAPAFWGSNPGIVPIGPEQGKIVLKTDHNLGLQLVNSHSPAQLEQTLVSSKTYGEILTQNQDAVALIPNNGIAYRQLQAPQKKLLKQIIHHHLDRMEKPVSQKAQELLENENWNEITFSWAGKTEKLKAHYYRIQGQSFLIEYDNSQNNGNHIHAVWREFNGDFGKDLIQEHYQKGGH